MASDATRDGLGRAIVAAEERLAVLVERAAGDSDSGPLLAEALEELHTALAELFAASEEVEVEHQAAFAANLRYQQLFEMLPDGVLITDAAGVVIELNQAAATALGAAVPPPVVPAPIANPGT